MANALRNQDEILQKLGIEALNAMQLEAVKAIQKHPEVILLSPTGTGKTLAFLLPIITELDSESKDIQALILVPTRELAIQIEQVIRSMGSGFKANAVYGGRSGYKDKEELSHTPSILVGTPGRVADHIRNETIAVDKVNTLVLDEFDKSLEIGFKNEMREIIFAVPKVKRKILTSATENVEIPDFAGIKEPKRLNYLQQKVKTLARKIVISPDKDRLKTLTDLLGHLNGQSGIIFCNFKETIQFVGAHLARKDIDYGAFHGGLEQVERERSLVKFRNGSHRILLATDLAARGIDVPELDFIIHYQLPLREPEFIHRNGRTGRMHSEGTAYILRWEKEELPSFIVDTTVHDDLSPNTTDVQRWCTLYITGGRRDKISKGDIAGLFFKQGGLNKDELGRIELKQDASFVAVPASKSRKLIEELNNSRLKKKKVRISLMN